MSYRVVGVLERLDGAGRCAEVKLRDNISLTTTLHCDAEQAASIQIPHLMATHARVVPIGDNQRAVRSDLDIRRPKPRVARPLQKIDNPGRVAGALIPRHIGPRYARPRVAMDQLAPQLVR